MAESFLSIVIPTLNEEELLPRLLTDLGQLTVPLEIIVADGGSSDGTPEVARLHGAALVTAPCSRAKQMNAGAQESQGEWLCFLHADVRLGRRAGEALKEAVADPSTDAAVWPLAIDGAGWWLRAVELGALVRDRLGGLPYGDQGLLVRRSLFEAVGGFPEIPVMEDVAIVRALRRRTTLRRLDAPLVVSARRWRRVGPIRGSLRNVALVSAYVAGVSPAILGRWYRPEPQ